MEIEKGINRRRFIGATTLSAGSLLLGCSTRKSSDTKISAVGAATAGASSLPMGNAPTPVPFPHFPTRLHAYVWRNWPLVPTKRLAAVIGATEKDILRMGKAMGLSRPPKITLDQQRRSYITVIRRNWHLLPYQQLLLLLGWTEEKMAFTLREDDFLFLKLGNSKPKCKPLHFAPPDEAMLRQEREIGRVVRENFSGNLEKNNEPLFHFVSELSKKPPTASKMLAAHLRTGVEPLRFGYSYFALYGDPLLETETDPYPDGYLARLAEAGVNGVWLQAVLFKLAPFPWDEKLSAHYKTRLENLRALVERAGKYGIGVYLYLNEPRSMPLRFFETRPQMKGVVEGDYAALCTSNKEVQNYLVESVSSVCAAVPELAGFFTITGSENLTNCWSHQTGSKCPRCATRAPSEVIAEVNGLFFAGIKKSGSKARLLVWDWGWADAWAPDIIGRLPQEAALMSVSEWSLPIRRGGIESLVGEYSISAIGPGPRAQRHWELARKRGLKTIAKIQAGNSWELGVVPYIPAIENVAQHAANLRGVGVDGLMLAWTLGGYPSPNLEVVAEISRRGGENLNPAQAMQIVAQRRFGHALAPEIVQAWHEFSAAFSEYPFHIGVVYVSPKDTGPSNLLWAEATGYGATMVGFPYDDLDAWRAVYPPEIFIAQFEKMADGFERALAKLKISASKIKLKEAERRALAGELNVAEASALHFRSVANQSRFIMARRALAAAKNAENAFPQITAIEKVLADEITCARRLFDIQSRDSRIGFEASNHYVYVPVDLMEKDLNCQHLLQTWLPAQKAKWSNTKKDL
ncbi:MAG: hypothetical protein ABI042_08920 [Verrucomicrobiota bacterium]